MWEILQKGRELEAWRRDVMIFNQCEWFGNHFWHHAVTGPAMEGVFRAEGGPHGQLGRAHPIGEAHGELGPCERSSVPKSCCGRCASPRVPGEGEAVGYGAGDLATDEEEGLFCSLSPRGSLSVGFTSLLRA